MASLTPKNILQEQNGVTGGYMRLQHSRRICQNRFFVCVILWHVLVLLGYAIHYTVGLGVDGNADRGRSNTDKVTMLYSVKEYSNMVSFVLVFAEKGGKTNKENYALSPHTFGELQVFDETTLVSCVEMWPEYWGKYNGQESARYDFVLHDKVVSNSVFMLRTYPSKGAFEEVVEKSMDVGNKRITTRTRIHSAGYLPRLSGINYRVDLQALRNDFGDAAYDECEEISADTIIHPLLKYSRGGGRLRRAGRERDESGPEDHKNPNGRE